MAVGIGQRLWLPAASMRARGLAFHTLVKSVPCLRSVQANLGVSVSGGVVTAWADQTGNGKHFTQGTGGLQFAYNAQGLNGMPTLTSDGVDDVMLSTLDLPAPGTTPTFQWMIYRILTNSPGTGYIIADSGGQFGLFAAAGAKTTAQFNGTIVNTNSGSNGSAWVRTESLFSNSAADYTKCGATVVQTGIAGNNDPAASRNIGGRSSALNPINVEYVAISEYVGAPSAAELAALSAAAVAYGGVAVQI